MPNTVPGSVRKVSALFEVSRIPRADPSSPDDAHAIYIKIATRELGIRAAAQHALAAQPENNAFSRTLLHLRHCGLRTNSNLNSIL